MRWVACRPRDILLHDVLLRGPRRPGVMPEGPVDVVEDDVAEGDVAGMNQPGARRYSWSYPCSTGGIVGIFVLECHPFMGLAVNVGSLMLWMATPTIRCWGKRDIGRVARDRDIVLRGPCPIYKGTQESARASQVTGTQRWIMGKVLES